MGQMPVNLGEAESESILNQQNPQTPSLTTHHLTYLKVRNASSDLLVRLRAVPVKGKRSCLCGRVAEWALTGLSVRDSLRS